MNFLKNLTNGDFLAGTVDYRTNVFSRDLVKLAVRMKCYYSNYIIIKEKAAWGQIKMLLEKGFC